MLISNKYKQEKLLLGVLINRFMIFQRPTAKGTTPIIGNTI